MIDKNYLKEKLKTSDVRFHFTFADKTKTSTLCTLDFSRIPKEQHIGIGPQINELQVAWDVEKNRWICFKWEKVISAD